jgi:uncharacterized protein (DUF2141 family)
MVTRLVTLLAVLAAAMAGAETHTLTVKVTGFKSEAGAAVFALHSDPAAFPTKPERAIATQRLPIKAGSCVAVFENLAPGWYAVAVYHDANGNSRLDTRFFGIPKEPTAASNNARGSMGPPKFADAKFEVKADATIEIRIN